MSFPKTHQNYWITRIKRRSYKTADGSNVSVSDYQIYLQHRGRREWFQLGSSNQVVAAKRAATIYQSLKVNGWDTTIREYKGEMIVKKKEVTVGEYLKAIQERSQLRPLTFTVYCRKIRRIVAELKGVAKSKDKYDYFNKKHLKWRAEIDKTPLSYLTADRLRKWQKKVIARAGHDPVKIAKAEHTINSSIRNARSLFSAKMVSLVPEMELPVPLPFSDCDMLKSASMRYRSKIEPADLVAAAEDELATVSPEQYKIFLLSLFAGLRRNEIDKLLWQSVDWARGEIVIEPHKFFSVKTSTSVGAVSVDPALMGILKSFHGKAEGSFVIESKVEPKVGKDYPHYRANSDFRKLSAWLRGKGVTTQSPIHTLRKEFGRLMTEKYGIYAASKALRHGGI